jgi:23S rRNA (pseudouridine1915-N3)-methyltransferase
MKLLVLAVGKPKKNWAREACEEYLQRLRGYVSLGFESVSPARGNPSQSSSREGKSILGSINSGDSVVLLDERGSSLESRGFSKKIISLLGSARGRVVCVVGGAYGVSPEVRARADVTLRLSDMTLPHELALVLLLEQLYRAYAIASGHPYHH